MDATKSAADIRTDITELRNRYTLVSHHERCCVCGFPIRANMLEFHIFPCRHAYHPECLVRQVRDDGDGGDDDRCMNHLQLQTAQSWLC